MRHRVPLTAAGLFCLVALSCTDREDGRTTDEPAAGEGVTGDPDRQAAQQPAAPNPVEPLADGSHGVYGLRIPRGMTPARGPNKVYRFEGTLQLKHLKRYVMRQVETGTIIEESTGYLIRKARVIDPVGAPDPGTLLALRIFRGRKGGASLDVWVEIDPSQAKQAGIHGVGGAGGASGDQQSPRLTASQAKQRAEERKKTFEMVESAGQGQGLPRDPENPLHY